MSLRNTNKGFIFTATANIHKQSKAFPDKRRYLVACACGLDPIHTTPEKFKNGAFTLKTH